MRVIALAVLTLLGSSPARSVAQEVAGKPGPRILLPRAREIALARSAAPASVSARAQVWVFQEGRYVVADSGTTGVACLVSRSWPESLEPHCFDEEGARTIMRIEMREVELLHRGVANAQVEREIAAALADGTFRLPSRPAMSWMQSAAQVLYDDEGRHVGAWKPHVMIYYPYLTAEGIGTGANQDLGAGIVVNPGRPTANLMIVVPVAVDPGPAGGTN